MQHQYSIPGSEYSDNYPSIADLEIPAKRRIPFFAWEYLDSGTGLERLVPHNRERLQAIEMVPRFFDGNFKIPLQTKLLGETYDSPFGIAPVGMTGLMWPGGEKLLAKTAARNNIPYGLSTVACQTPETVGPLCEGNGWFQLYVPSDREMCIDVINRAWQSGFRTLIVTADVPTPSMRERQRKAGLKVPPDNSLKSLFRVAIRPHWAWATLRHGKPGFPTLEKYAKSDDMQEVSSFLGRELSDALNLEYLKFIRDNWQGKLIVKGILHEDDAKKLVKAGVDGIVVSNHGGRQFDGAPAAIDVLPVIVKAVGKKCAIIYDSGIRSGLDVIRALALGAEFVLLGRPFLYGIAALGEFGGDHVVEILNADLTNNYRQLGVRDISQLSSCLRQPANNQS